MIKCQKCGIENDEDSFFCKRCGFPLDETPEDYNQNNVKVKNKKGRNKVKNKSKVKTKIKYKDNNEKQKGKMSFFQSFMMFFFILLSICALAVAAFLGYYIYQNSNIEVPDVLGYTYEDAKTTLKDNKLQVQMSEEIVEDEDKVGIVIKQNKKAGSKVMENTIVKLTVGKLDTKITVPDVTGLKLEDAINILNKNNVKFKIEYETEKEDNIVLKQSIKAGKKIEKSETIVITVSKKEITETPSNTEENNDEENPITNEDKNNN